MTVKPIPDCLLGDSFTLLSPTDSGFERTEIYNVRIERVSQVSDYASTRMRDLTELTIRFDCVNSFPAGTEFCAGQQAEYRGERFELLEVKLYSTDKPHHYTIKAKKIGGEYIG